MNKKLTLRLNSSVIEKAKKYAKQNNTSLSELVEVYFDSVTNNKNRIQITPLVESLCGVIELPDSFDYQKSKSKYLLEKHK